MKKYILYIVLGIFHFFLGLFLAGAGHGWVTAFFFSIPSLLFYPLSKYIITIQNKRMARAIFYLNILLTLGLIYQSKNEGIEYLVKIFNSIPLLIICYFILWFGWGSISLIILFQKNNSNS